MSTTLVIAFILSGVSLVCSLLIYVQHRRSGMPVPRSQVGGMMGSIGMPLFVAGTSTLFNDGVAMVLVLVGALLTISSAVMVFRARRQMRSGGR